MQELSSAKFELRFFHVLVCFESVMEPEVEGDEEDYYVTSRYDELVGTPSTPSLAQIQDTGHP